MAVNKSSKEFWFPLKINHKNYHLNNKAKRWFKISNLGNLKVTAKKREVLIENNEAKIGANNVKISNDGLSIRLFYNKKYRGYHEQLVNLFIRSCIELNPKSFEISYKDNDPRNINYENVRINNKSIKNIILFRYQNIKALTEYEKVFFDVFRLVSSEKKTEWNRIFKIYNKTHRIKERVASAFLKSQKIFLKPESFYIADYFFPIANVIIEIDGLHHYSNKKQMSHDLERDTYLINTYKVDIIRISNLCLFKGKNKIKLIRKIQEIVLNKLEANLLDPKFKEKKELLHRQSAAKLLYLQNELFANRFN